MACHNFQAANDESTVQLSYHLNINGVTYIVTQLKLQNLNNKIVVSYNIVYRTV